MGGRLTVNQFLKGKASSILARGTIKENAKKINCNRGPDNVVSCSWDIDP